MQYLENLYSKFLQSAGVFTDTRKPQEGGMYFALKGPNFDGNQYAVQAWNQGAKFVVIDNPQYAFSEHCIIVPDTLIALQQLATLHRTHMPAKVIGLTGSNGKTTTKELLHAVIRTTYATLATEGNLNNHIGVPLTLLRLQAKHEIAIIEMGANHQGEIAALTQIARPEIGCITNYGLAHLEGFGGIEGVVKGKSELFRFLSETSGVAIVPKYDLLMMEKTANQDRFVFGAAPASCVVSSIALATKEGYAQILLGETTVSSQLFGQYNANNMMLAAAVGQYLSIPIPKIKAALEGYTPKMNRSELRKTSRNYVLLDAYNANPSSMEAAIASFSTQKGPKAALLGDMFELGRESASLHQHIIELTEERLPEATLYFVGQHFYNSTPKNDKTLTFKNRDTLEAYLSKHPLEGYTILLKGSRGMALEKLLPVL